MLFTSALYIVLFLPATLLAYWLAPARLRIGVLLVASYAFYLSWNPRYGALLAASTVANFAIAQRLQRAGAPRWLLPLGVAMNLAVLATFKYLGLFSSSAADLADLLGLARTGSFDGLRVVLPLAISFFTFEMISVLVDAARGHVRVEGFWPFAAYKAFFPKLLSGPITRYAELGPQLAAPAPLTGARALSGVTLFAVGLAKKLALANNLALLANPVFDAPGSVGGGAALLGILAFGFQIYFDFSAYTDMARGTSRLLGLELPHNFRLPYAATSPRDFWRRWHMSLSRWLRDYLYIPLGGNRRGRGRTYANLLITMLLGGLWHGAAWHFALWGGMHGAFLAGDHALGRRRASWRRAFAARAAGWALTMALVFAAWVFFRAHSFAGALDVFAALGHPLRLFEPSTMWHGMSVAAGIAALVVLLVATPLAPAALARLRVAEWRARPLALAAAAVACWTGAALLAPSVTQTFYYFRF